MVDIILLLHSLMVLLLLPVGVVEVVEKEVLIQIIKVKPVVLAAVVLAVLITLTVVLVLVKDMNHSQELLEIHLH